MDLTKWRVAKGSGHWWCVFPPHWEQDAVATLTFDRAIQELMKLQCDYYMRSRRWRDG